MVSNLFATFCLAFSTLSSIFQAEMVDKHNYIEGPYSYNKPVFTWLEVAKHKVIFPASG